MENEEQGVVNPVEQTTAAEPEAVEVQEVASPEQPVEEAQKVETPVADAGQKSVSNDLDEFGVPYKNRYMEYKRKFEKSEEEKQKISQQTQAQAQPQRQYSVAELEAFALETDNPAHKQWAINEAERIREERTTQLIRKELKNCLIMMKKMVNLFGKNGNVVGLKI